MENENKTPLVDQPINNQSTPVQPETPTPTPTVEAPAEIQPVVEPIRIGKPFPESVEVLSSEKKPTESEEAWLNKAKPDNSKVTQLKEDLAQEKTSVDKFKTALERLKAKRLQFKADFPIAYWWTFAGIVIAGVCLFLWLIYFFIFYQAPEIITHDLRCNPYKERCFIWECDSEAVKGDEDYCTGDPKKDTLYYKMEQRMSNKIPYCDPAEPDCQPFRCEKNEKNCGIVYCEDGNEDEIPCNDPQKYAAENPASGEEDFQGLEDVGDYGDGEDCEEDECEDDEYFEDEVIDDETDNEEDLQAEQDALQEAEKLIKGK